MFSAFYKALSGFLNNLLQIIGYSIFLIYSDIEMAIYFAIGGLIFDFSNKKYLLSRGKSYQVLSFNTGKEINTYIQRVLDNIFLIKILDTRKKEFELFKARLEKNKNAWIKNNVFGALNSMLPSFATLFFLSLILAFFDFAKNLTIEFIGVLLRMFQSLGNFNNTLTLVVNSSVHVDELYKLEENKSPEKNKHYIVNSELENAIEINKLNFKYFGSDENIFSNLNLNLKKNSHSVITGPNGSGKSTLLGLIAGLYIPQSGNISIYSNKIGYVGVNPLIVSENLKRKSNLWKPKRSRRHTQIHKLIEKFSLFEDEIVDLNKAISIKNLSSGQMQKISFIRALLNDVEVLILDESTSNLDKPTKDLIFDILLKNNLTIINSTHNEEDFQFDNHIKIVLENSERKLIIN